MLDAEKECSLLDSEELVVLCNYVSGCSLLFRELDLLAIRSDRHGAPVLISLYYVS